jgi:hypothetical protein
MRLVGASILAEVQAKRQAAARGRVARAWKRLEARAL